MAKTKDVPVFGNLKGLKVLSTGSVVAEPYAATLMAEFGATVIQLESTISPDSVRAIKYGWAQEHRNELALALNIPSPEGREIFLKLIKWADVFMESSKGGTYKAWGLTDEVLWEYNPKLVIVHVSGFGQTGVQSYVERASYDAIGQAFGGYMYINGMPEPNPPLRAGPYTCDYFTALFAAWTALAAYINAERTGKGESIDLAQFEVMQRIQLHYPGNYLNEGKLLERQGNDDPMFAAYTVFRCKDGVYVMIGFAGGGVMKRGLPFLGLDKDPDFPEGIQLTFRGSPAGIKLEKAIKDYCDTHTGLEVEQGFMTVGVPCNRVYNFEMAVNDPHYQAREVFTEWDDPKLGKVKGVNIIPKFEKNPGKIWRGSPLYGWDNDDILGELGYNQEQIAELYEKKIIKKDKSLM
jgi:crotonobetainyl-CoA:carnitine CoA-transferase CaiB-like acyl-CoA transferase